MTIFVDHFTGTDGTDVVGTTDPAGGTYVGTGAWLIDTNAVKDPGDTSFGALVFDSGAADVTVSTAITGDPDVNHDAGVVLRWTDSSHWFRAVWYSGAIYITHRNGGGEVVDASAAYASITGHTLSCEVVGNQYTAKVDGSTVVSYTDTGNLFLTETKHGLSSNWGGSGFPNPGVRFDDLTVDTGGGASFGQLESNSILGAFTLSGPLSPDFGGLVSTSILAAFTVPEGLVFDRLDTTSRLAGFTFVDPPGQFDTWWAQLSTHDGTLLAKAPQPSLSPIPVGLNQSAQTSMSITSAANPQAAQIIAQASQGVLPGVEVQIWRGRKLVFWGPIVNAAYDKGVWECQLQDPMWHLHRRAIGRLGYNNSGWQGDPGPGDYLENPQFADGFDGWDLMLTTGFNQFDTVDPGIVTVDMVTPPPAPGATVLNFSTPVTGEDQYQAYQDLVIRTLPDNPLKYRFAVYVRVPEGATFVQQARPPSVFLALLNYPIDDLSDYFLSVVDAKETPIPADIPRDKWTLIESPELEVPALTGAVLHCAIRLPQGDIQIAITDGPLYDDGGIVALDGDPAQVVDELVGQAQRVDLGKSNVNITTVWTPTGKKVNRKFAYESHPYAGDAIEQLSSDGYLDWWFGYFPTERGLFAKALRGQYRPECRISNRSVTNPRFQSQWSSGATAVAVQSQGDAGRHEVAASIPDVVTIEDVSVASRETTPADLYSRATERLETIQLPHTLEFDSLPGRMLTLDPGDWTDALLDTDGLYIDNTTMWRCIKAEPNPMTDTTHFTMNPYTP